MLFTVMYQMAALAKRLEVFRMIISRVVIEVGGRQNHLGCADDNARIYQRYATQRPSASVAPCPHFIIPPPPVAQMLNFTTMRAAAFLAPAFGSFEPD